MTSGQDTWSARCVETRTAGAAGGPGKPTGSDPGRAPRSDPTGAFRRSELYPLLRRVNTYLMRWLMNKLARYRTWKKATQAWTGAAARKPRYFAHWDWVKPARQMTRTEEPCNGRLLRTDSVGARG